MSPLPFSVHQVGPVGTLAAPVSRLVVTPMSVVVAIRCQCVLLPLFLHGLPQAEALFDETQISRRPPIDELLPHVSHMAQRDHNNLNRSSDDLARARHELARTEADLRASQARVDALEARVQAPEMVWTFVP